MSLINDALRRAKQAQKETPPADPTPVSHFRPVEPAIQPVRHSVGLLLPVALTLVALLALLLLWELSRRGSSPAPVSASSPLNVAARVMPSATAAPSSTEAPSSQSAPADVASSAAQKPAANNTPATSVPIPDHNAATAPLSNSASSVTNPAMASPNISDTNSAAATEPAPPPLKLQGIVYNPRRPSALINGRVVFVGDRIRDLKISAIHADNVVLTGMGRTNLLSLEP